MIFLFLTFLITKNIYALDCNELPAFDSKVSQTISEEISFRILSPAEIGDRTYYPNWIPIESNEKKCWVLRTEVNLSEDEEKDLNFNYNNHYRAYGGLGFVKELEQSKQTLHKKLFGGEIFFHNNFLLGFYYESLKFKYYEDIIGRSQFGFKFGLSISNIGYFYSKVASETISLKNFHDGGKYTYGLGIGKRIVLSKNFDLTFELQWMRHPQDTLMSESSTYIEPTVAQNIMCEIITAGLVKKCGNSIHTYADIPKTSTISLNATLGFFLY